MVLKPEQLTELEHKAARGDEMPELLPAPTQLWYLSMRTLYHQYRAGRLTRQQAKTEKARIWAEYKKNTELWAQTRRLAHVFTDRLQDTQAKRDLFCQLRAQGADAEELLPIACDIVRLITGDESITPHPIRRM